MPLLLPRPDLHWQHALLLRDVVDRLLAFDGLQGHLGLKLRTELSSFSLHGSLGLNTLRTRSPFVYPLAPFRGTTSISSGPFLRALARMRLEFLKNVNLIA